MGLIMSQLKNEEGKEEKKKFAGEEQKKEKPANLSPDPSVDEYVLFYHTSWQPGVPEHLYEFKKPL